jgi:two-component system, sensor histidine kinase
MSSHDYASTWPPTWPEVDIEVGATGGHADDSANGTEAHLRSRLLRTTAANAGLSAAALIGVAGVAIYLGWLGQRLLDSRSVENTHAWSTWATAFLLVLYGLAAWLLSVAVRRTAHQLLRLHHVTKRAQREALEREQAKLAQAQSAARTAELAAAERQQLLMAKVGHEVRTPAQIIMSDVEFLEERLSDQPELHLTLHRLGSAAELISHQMQSIADFARSQSLRADDRVQRVNLHVVINDIANLHANAADAKGLKLAVDSQDVELTVDLGKLRQIVANLVGNAVKYTAQGTVNVRADVRATAQGPRELVIVVADTGIGIPQDVQDRVFEPFFRVPQSSPKKDGLGLGLAIVKSLVGKLGGRVELHSSFGEGTTVSVVIPLVE